jgi:hypothetical protein
MGQGPAFSRCIACRLQGLYTVILIQRGSCRESTSVGTRTHEVKGKSGERRSAEFGWIHFERAGWVEVVRKTKQLD